MSLLWIAGCGEPAAASNQLLDLERRRFELWPENEDSAATVIHFTRAECPISNRYAPTVKDLYETYRPKGIRFYLAYVDPKETSDRIRCHMAEYGYPCPALRDPAHSLVAATGANVTPEAVVFTAKHENVYRGRIDDLYADYGQARDEVTTHELPTPSTPCLPENSWRNRSLKPSAAR